MARTTTASPASPARTLKPNPLVPDLEKAPPACDIGKPSLLTPKATASAFIPQEEAPSAGALQIGGSPGDIAQSSSTNGGIAGSSPAIATDNGDSSSATPIIIGDDETSHRDATSLLKSIVANLPDTVIRVPASELLALLESHKSLKNRLNGRDKQLVEVKAKQAHFRLAHRLFKHHVGLSGMDTNNLWSYVLHVAESKLPAQRRLAYVGATSDDINEELWLENVLGLLGITFSKALNSQGSGQPAHTLSPDVPLAAGDLQHVTEDFYQVVSKGRWGPNGEIRTIVHKVPHGAVHDAFKSFENTSYGGNYEPAIRRRRVLPHDIDCTSIGLPQTAYKRPLSPVVFHLKSMAANDEWPEQRRSKPTIAKWEKPGHDQQQQDGPSQREPVPEPEQDSETSRRGLTWHVEENAKKAHLAPHSQKYMGRGATPPKEKAKNKAIPETIKETAKEPLSAQPLLPKDKTAKSLSSVQSREESGKISGTPVFSHEDCNPRYRIVIILRLPRDITDDQVAQMIRGGNIEKIMIFRDEICARAEVLFLNAFRALEYYKWLTKAPIWFNNTELKIKLGVIAPLTKEARKGYDAHRSSRTIWVSPFKTWTDCSETDVWAAVNSSLFMRSTGRPNVGLIRITKTNNPPGFRLACTYRKTAIDLHKEFARLNWKVTFNKDPCDGPLSELPKSRKFMSKA